jgi:hypothetical protein
MRHLFAAGIVAIAITAAGAVRAGELTTCCLAPDYAFYGGAQQCVPCKKERATSTSTPVFKYRKLYVEEGHSHTAENLKQMIDWMPKVGYNVLVVPTDYQGHGRVKWDNWREELTPELKRRGILIEVGGHGYQNFINAKMDGGRLFEEHPEWYGADSQGRRQSDPKWAFCTSNVAAVDFFTSNVIAYLGDRPEIDIFDCWPPDGAKWCECTRCTQLGSPSNRQAVLINKLAARLRQALPKVRLEVLAYHTSIMPPESVKLDSSVLLDFCPISQCFEVQINDAASTTNLNYAQSLKAWRSKFDGDISIYTYYRKYAWDSLPVVIPHYIQKDVQFYRTIPVQGISIYSEPADWGTYEINHYVLAKLAWDANADVDAILREFCQTRYGEAADAAANSLRALEQVVPHFGSLPGTSAKPPEQSARAEARLRAAQLDLTNAARDHVEDEPTSASLNRLNLMLEYAERDIELRRMRAAGILAEQLTKKVDDLTEFISIRRNKGVFLASENRVSQARLMKKYAGPAENPVNHAP